MTRRSDAPHHHLDEVSKAIIEQLQADGRRSYAAIGKAVGLSEAAVRQRVQRLVDAGVTSILNFALTVVSAPAGVSLRKVDLAIELQILSFYQQRRDDAPAMADGRRNGETAARR